MEFRFTARSPRGRVVRGLMRAVDEADARGELARGGYSEIRLDQAGPNGRPAVPVPGAPAVRRPSLPARLVGSLARPSLQEVAVCTHQLAVMLGSGIGVDRALHALSHQRFSPGLETALRDVHADVLAGSPLSRAMGRHGEVFRAVYVGLVQAGEASGELPAVLNHLAGLLEREVALRGRLQAAMTYPCVVAALSLVVAFIIVTHVLPTFLNQLIQGVQLLPLPTRILVTVTQLVSDPRVLSLAALAAVAVGLPLRSFLRTPGGQAWLHRWALRIPFLRDVVRRALMSRFARTLGTLMESGVPVLQALELTGSALAHRPLAEALELVQSDLRSGQPLALSLRSVELFPPFVCHLVEVGEESGQTAPLLRRVADFYDQELEAGLETFASVLEPLLVGGLGLFVTFVLLALFLPIYQLIASI